MVIIRYVLILFLWVSSLVAEEAQITVSLSAGEVLEHQPIPLTVTILHEKTNQIDTNSFQIDGKQVAVDYIKDVAFSGNGNLVLTFYKITLDGLKQGLQMIPPISVKVGDQVVTSIPSTFEVGSLAASPNKSTGKLKLEAFIDGKQPIYPGQRVRFVYRYIFNDDIELTKENIPLLDAPGFQKIGARKVNDYEKNGFSIREVSQEVEAIKPGQFNFPASNVEGYTYRLDPFGSRMYQKPMITADAPAVSLLVKDFPAEGKPASFNGALGPFDFFSIAPISGSNVVVGEKLALAVKIGGKGRLDSVPLPELCCQPGFSGRFQVEDLPPSSTTEGEVKTFTVEMRPLSDTIDEFPQVEFSFFNPENVTYGVLRSKSFPITVSPAVQKQQSIQKPVQKPVKPINNATTPIEIESVKKIGEGDLENVRFGSPWVYWLIPLGALIVGGIIYSKRTESTETPLPKVEQSPIYLKEALLAGPKEPRFIPLASKALLTRLVEKGVIPSLVSNPEKLPDEGMAGEVRRLLQELEEHRFSGVSTPLDPNIVDRIKQIYKLI